MHHAIGAAMAAALLLIGCGGGGGDGEPEAYDLAAAYVNLTTQDRSWTLTGTNSDGDELQYVVTTAVGPVTTFPYNRRSGQQSITTLAVTEGGVVLPTETVLSWYDTTTQALMGSQSGKTCNATTDTAALPADAAVDDTGPLYTLNSYDGCSASSALTGTTRYTWSVERIDGRVFMCSVNTSATSIVIEITECYEINTSGDIGTRAQFMITSQRGSNLDVLLQVKNF